MKPEQIEMLKALEIGVPKDEEEWDRRASLAWEAFPTLLREREQLLGALRALLYTTVLREEDMPITGPAIKGARAAIAAAES